MSVFRQTSGRKVKSTLQQKSISAEIYEGKPLTASEMRVLRFIVNGRSNKEIARLLHRSVRTIEGHRAHLMQKLGVDNSVDLVTRAAVTGLVELPAEQKRGKATSNQKTAHK
jgi:DNA-binding NarL/FixJ family response regulator